MESLGIIEGSESGWWGSMNEWSKCQISCCLMYMLHQHRSSHRISHRISKRVWGEWIQKWNSSHNKKRKFEKRVVVSSLDSLIHYSQRIHSLFFVLNERRGGERIGIPAEVIFVLLSSPFLLMIVVLCVLFSDSLYLLPSIWHLMFFSILKMWCEALFQVPSSSFSFLFVFVHWGDCTTSFWLTSVSLFTISIFRECLNSECALLSHKHSTEIRFSLSLWLHAFAVVFLRFEGRQDVKEERRRHSGEGKKEFLLKSLLWLFICLLRHTRVPKRAKRLFENPWDTRRSFTREKENKLRG